MPPVDRLQPIRAASSESGYTLLEFMREYPDDETCLQYLWRTRYSPDGETAYCPKCERDRLFKRYAFATRRQSWTCTGCGHHITPTAEGFFGSSKNAIRGVYHGVSPTWLQGYLNEFAWRYNNRGDRNTMFRDLLNEAASKPL